jgi:hypothetical protein
VLGVVHDLGDLSPTAAAVVLDRMAEPSRDLALAALLAVWAWLAESSADVSPPQLVRAWTGAASVVVEPASAVVVDEPKWLQRNDIGPFVIAARGEVLADLLDLDLASERAEGEVTSVGTDEPVPGVVARLVPSGPAEWCRHDRLEVDGCEVGWWVDDDGRIHAAHLEGLGHALAWATGRWADRLTLAAVLRDPGAVSALEQDAAFD